MFLQEAELRLLLARRSMGCRKAGVSIPSPGDFILIQIGMKPAQV